MLSSSLRTWFVARQRLLLLLGLALAFVSGARAAAGAGQGELNASLAEVLRREGLVVDEETIVWLDHNISVLSARRAFFAAQRSGELSDVYVALARVGGGDTVLDVAAVNNLTRTSGAAETAPVLSGDFLLYASKVQDVFDAVVVLDPNGEPRQLTLGWPLLARLQNAITNLQETGRATGIGRRRYAIDPPAGDLGLHVEHGRVLVSLDGGRVSIDSSGRLTGSAADRLHAVPEGKGRPGLVSWVVDTVRNLSWVGPEPIAWLEHRVFGFKDAFERARHALFGTDTETQVAEDLAVVVRHPVSLAVVDPQLGWPPPPLRPVLPDPPQGEGEWIEVQGDPFVRSFPEAPSAFAQTFIRVDPERLFTEVFIVALDPRQVQLHVMTGTREPESATGETGPGMIARDPETLRWLVGAFNGGFQALHGEFGMVVEGRVYLPPKPWAATVGVYSDGRVALGSWLPPPEGTRVYDERWAVAQIPSDMISLRQNLTSVIENGVFNPWRRWYWGAAPLDADEQTFIHRSGLCLTEEGFLAYFWGRSMGPEALGAAMRATRCVRGMHLDMNDVHTGFEFYNVSLANESRPAIGREIRNAEYDGPLFFSEGYWLRSRKAVAGMAQMTFPRWVRRDPRDFFYLTLRPRLPGRSVTLPSGATAVFDTHGLPHAGWPPAFARAHAGDQEDHRVWIVRLDGSRAVPGPVAHSEAQPLAYLSGCEAPCGDGPLALQVAIGGGAIRFSVGAPVPGTVVLVHGHAVTTDSVRAIGVDGNGWIVYVERERRARASLGGVLLALGVERAIDLPRAMRLAFVAGDSVAGVDSYENNIDVRRALGWFADERPAAEVLFPAVQPRPYAVWSKLQDARVRYFREGAPRFGGAPTDGGTDADAGMP